MDYDIVDISGDVVTVEVASDGEYVGTTRYDIGTRTASGYGADDADLIDGIRDALRDVCHWPVAP